MKNANRPPGPKTKNPLGFIHKIRGDIIGFLTRIALEYGDIVNFRVGPMQMYFLNHPDYIKDVLVTNQRNFSKGRPLELAKRLLGEGLLTSEGAFHLRQRRMIQPIFHKKRIESYGVVMTEYATRLGDRWVDGATVDMANEMMQMALAIASKTMFSTDIETESVGIGKALTDAMSLFDRVSIPLSELLLNLPLPSTLRFYRAKAHLDKTIYRMIEDRRKNSEKYDDLLALLLSAQDEEGDKSRMTDEQVRDEALIFLLAAYDTTALALTWTWYLLSQYPQVESALHAEIDSVLGGRLPSVEDLPQLTFTRMVFTEAMRLYPPGYIIARKALDDYEIDNYFIPAGSTILMSPFVMQRDPRYYNEPRKFNPLRWAGEAHANAPKFAYFPFGGGPRVCIGDSFAWLEGCLVMATLAQRWRMILVPGHPVAILPLLNLRPKYGMRMILECRRYGKK